MILTPSTQNVAQQTPKLMLKRRSSINFAQKSISELPGCHKVASNQPPK
jgi:hypothetical protein